MSFKLNYTGTQVNEGLGKSLDNEAFTLTKSNKLDGVETGAEVNTLASINVGNNASLDDTDPLNPIINVDQKMQWVYPWVQDTYDAQTQTRIGDWLMVSNTETSDYPAPISSNNPEWGITPDPVWTADLSLGDLAYGYEFTATEMSTIKGWRIWAVATENVTYTVQLWDYNNENNPILLGSDYITQNSPEGWIEVFADEPAFTLLPNNKFRFSVVVHSTTNDLNYNGEWLNVDGVTTPTSGVVTLNTSVGSKVLINKTDNLGVDLSTELLAIGEGDSIRFNETADVTRYSLYRATGVSVDQGTYVEIPISLQDEGNGIRNNKSVNTEWIVYGADTNTDYVKVTNGIPTYFPNGNVEGFFTTIIGDVTNPSLTLDNNIYGLDILSDPWIKSDDWDVASYFGSNSGTSQNTEVITTRLIQSLGDAVNIELTDTSDDKGVAITGGQFSVGSVDNPQESVFGEGDSYPVNLAYHCSFASTSGDVISGATDVTEILRTDTGSTTGLFGGITTDDYILVGSDYPFQGVKFKFSSGGTVDPENVQGEYYGVSGWTEVYTMTTNAVAPYQQSGYEIGNYPSEQLRFGFDPLNRENWATKHIISVNGVPTEKYWGRYKITSNIVQDPILEQMKLHTNRMEINSDGVSEYFGSARYPKTLTFGLEITIPNDLADPANEVVAYGSRATAKYVDNEFQNDRVDGFLLTQDVVTGLDTSIPLICNISYYVKGTATGNIRIKSDVFQVGDGFVYDGTAIPDTYVVDDNVLTSSNLVRRTSSFLIDIYKLKVTGALLISLYRDATGAEPLDTLSAGIVVTNVSLIGHFWRP